jgi:Malectin domain
MLYGFHSCGGLKDAIHLPLNSLHSSFTTPLARIFDVDVEGTTLNDIDVVQLANNTAFTAVTRKATVLVRDSLLTIQFLTNVPAWDNPSINGIEINQVAAPVAPAAPVGPINAPVVLVAPVTAPVTAQIGPMAPLKVPLAPSAAPMLAPVTLAVPTTVPARPAFEPILINCGGGAYTDKRRRVWMADKYNEGGMLFSTNKDIIGTEDDELYQYHRWGQLTYNVPVPLGTYEVILHSAEI